MNLDLDTVKTVGSVIGTAVAAPVVYVWKRAVGAVQRDELLAAVSAITARLADHEKQDREQFAGLFERVDGVAQSTARIEGYMQAQRDAHG